MTGSLYLTFKTQLLILSWQRVSNKKSLLAESTGIIRLLGV